MRVSKPFTVDTKKTFHTNCKCFGPENVGALVKGFINSIGT